MIRKQDQEQVLGRGLSGVVLLATAKDGRRQARKVFVARGLARLIHRVFYGAPNAYVWNESAVQSAVLRRRILCRLVQWWFPDRLKVAEAYEHAWNPDHKAYELRCELITGGHVPLKQPFSDAAPDPLPNLLHLMHELQGKLQEAGFDGLLWQAGRGNPVAVNNFMLESRPKSGQAKWAWIDLESGVPAVIPINPMDLLGFYLPRCIFYGRALFDDVNIDTLRNYLQNHRVALRDRFGEQGVTALERDCAALCDCQRRWKSMPRLRRGIAYRYARGQIDAMQADWHVRHPFGWYALEAIRGTQYAIAQSANAGRWVCTKLGTLRLANLIRGVWRFVSSQAYRNALASTHIERRIDSWQSRAQLPATSADVLKRQLKDTPGGSDLADFAVHLGIKPLIKGLQWWIFPALWAFGLIDERALALFIVCGGAVGRTAYTAVRCVQECLAGRAAPWVALGVGVAPIIGNLAFPVQILFRSADPRAALAQFIVYDNFTQCGRLFPIWGGRDTLFEHVCNRIADGIIHRPWLRPKSPEPER